MQSVQKDYINDPLIQGKHIRITVTNDMLHSGVVTLAFKHPVSKFHPTSGCIGFERL